MLRNKFPLPKKHSKKPFENGFMCVENETLYGYSNMNVGHIFGSRLDSCKQTRKKNETESVFVLELFPTIAAAHTNLSVIIVFHN
jgi:hypothetical protein